MSRRDQSGYALVAVLIAVSVLLALGAMIASHMNAARDLAATDSASKQAEMLAQTALNRAIQVAHARGINAAWNGVATCAPLHPENLGPEYLYISPDTAADPHREDKLNQNAWLYTGPICDPTVAADVVTSRWLPTAPVMLTGWYHFVYVWLDESGRPTNVSPTISVNYTDNRSTRLAYIPPRSQVRRFELPLEAAPPYYYRMYVTHSGSAPQAPNPATDPTKYYPITEGRDTTSCLYDTDRICLQKMPARPANSSLELTGRNDTSVLRFYVEGWRGEAKRVLSGMITHSLYVKFYYSW